MERKHPNLIKRLLTARKRIFIRWYKFTNNITWLKKVIFFQHRVFPIPLFLYDYLFRFHITKVLFNFYGHHIWLYKYGVREGNHLGYWNSKDSLYWHFWCQTDINENIKKILEIPEINACLQNSELVACELALVLENFIVNSGVTIN